MLTVEGLFLGAAVVPGEEKQGYNGPYRSKDRYVVAVGTGAVDELPQYHNCDNEQVMQNLRRSCAFGEPVRLTGRRAEYGRLSITGGQSAAPARAS